MNACHVVVIDCPNESMAFDMFQALNATGTPLTAFEVFRPVIVNTCGNNYSKVLKPFVDRIDKVFDNESTASGKEELTDKVIASSALLYNGSTINNKFSVERDWLVDNFTPYPDPLASEFVCLIADQAEYRNQFIRPRKSPRNSQNFGLVTHLQNLGLNSGQADLSALCVFYLRDAGHQFAHSVISVFYAKLLRAQGNTQKVAAAAEEFLAVCKATAAFFTLWMGALQGRFPDPVYRQLFQTEGSNMSLVEGKPNQTSTFVKEKLKAALQEQGIFDAKSISQSRQKWISKANSSQWYLKKTVCRFALFAAFNDAAPDLAKGNEGLFINGQDESASFLTCKKWHSSDYEVVEHVATREEPNKIKFSAYFDRNIYPGNKSIVDKIGNLTLLSTAVNSSIYSEWPDKVFYYWSLTQPQATVKGPSGDKLKSALKLTSIPPGHSSLTAASSYLAHLAPLAFRGINGLPWDKNFIDKRSNHLCERIFNTIGPWLN